MYHRVVWNPAASKYVVLRNLYVDTHGLSDRAKEGLFKSTRQAYAVCVRMNRRKKSE